MATDVATTKETMKIGNVRAPVIAMLVKVAKSPPAGVNAPYMNDWYAATKDPNLVHELVTDPPQEVLFEQQRAKAYRQRYQQAQNQVS